MKKVMTFLVAALAGLAVAAQDYTGIVTITVKGNRNKEVLVDGRYYTVTHDASAANNVNLPITLEGLSSGQHSLQVVRTNANSSSTTTGPQTSFYLRPGYDMDITINANGGIRLSEEQSASSGYSGSGYAPMSDANFRLLLNNVRGVRTTNGRVVAINNAFNNTGNHFTTSQAMQLITLISSQTNRLALAKASYKTITDPQNFSNMNSLLTSSARRRELQEYVDEFGYNNTGSPVSSTQFNEMYLSARQQWSNTERVNYIASLFSGETYHFTTTQTRQLILLVTSESDRLYLAKSAWDNLADPANYTQLFDLFNSTAARNEFSTFVNSNGSYTPTRTAMSSSEFNTLYNGVSNTWGLGAKQTKLTNIFNDANNIFTVAQVRQLISLVSSESNRVQLGKLAYNNVVDPENYTQLYDLLSTQAAKNELDAYVRQNAVGPVYGSNTAMSSDNFSRLYDDISNQWGIGAKYSSLTDAFNNSSYYFTTAQARMLIALVSSESNRLQLAKLSYDNITDRENFRNLYDLFSSQSSRSELDDYVKAYSYNH